MYKWKYLCSHLNVFQEEKEKSNTLIKRKGKKIYIKSNCNYFIWKNKYGWSATCMKGNNIGAGV